MERPMSDPQSQVQPASNTGAPVRLAVVGAGLVGRQHIDAIAAVPCATLAAVADPSPAACALAQSHGAAFYDSIEGVLKGDVDGVVLATPNALHRAGAEAAIAAGVPVLVEKPLAGSLSDGEAMVEAAVRAGVALLTGHHRRHNPKIAAAKAAIDAGAIGRPVAAHATLWLMKPDDYFDVAWRCEPGGGPILINAVHEVDTLRHLVGDVEAVTARTRSSVRNFAVEDTAAVIIEFVGGALGTRNLCDATPAPWSWELTAGENPAYPVTRETSGMIAGTEGAIAIPSATLWHPKGPKSWWSPMSATAAHIAQGDTLQRQIADFAAVIQTGQPPLVSGADGLESLRVVDAISRSAQTGERVVLAQGTT